MKVQRVLLPNKDERSWVVIDDDFIPLDPVNNFLRYLINLERSPHTVRAYAHHLKLFWEFLKQSNLNWTAVALSHLAEFVSWLRFPTPVLPDSSGEVSPLRSEATVNVILASVASFYDYHERMGEVSGIPLFRLQSVPLRPYKAFLHHISKHKVAVRVLKLRAPKRLPRTLTAEQVQQLIDQCQRVRDRFLLCLLNETGMRIGQALGLRHEDIRSFDNEIHLRPRPNSNGARSKTRDPYVIHVSKALMDLYAE